MREILFRGKRVDNGEWVEGNLFYNHDGRVFIGELVVNNYKGTAADRYEIGTDIVNIDPATVGQYTGLCDKNGKKIFEGDVVQYYGTCPLEICIEKGHVKIRFVDDVTNRECTGLFFGYDEESFGGCEIIGNIHDNPELLED